ncbi:hypothetical protein ANN_19485 [Periplaneta americana]|uniref:Uncharacterized protein n=1 Tax=Periplaneta americana TaxID=6978 RepID=A0ABQ8SAL1_PERAM|nr:hypothetical protein ANN_19485 [Periplaneta americana]
MPSTWPGIEPVTLGIEGQRYTNSPTRSTTTCKTIPGFVREEHRLPLVRVPIRMVFSKLISGDLVAMSWNICPLLQHVLSNDQTSPYSAIFREVMSEQVSELIAGRASGRFRVLHYNALFDLAQHSIEKEHKILFDHTKVINKSSHYWESTIKEAIEIKLEKNNFNRDSGLQVRHGHRP